MKDKILPFLPLQEVYDNIYRDPISSELFGDCKICKQQKIPIIKHGCFKLAYEGVKNAFYKREKNNNSST